MARKIATDLKPGDRIVYRNGLELLAQRVTIRNGFSGPLAVTVDHQSGREIYAPTSRIRVA